MINLYTSTFLVITVLALPFTYDSVPKLPFFDSFRFCTSEISEKKLKHFFRILSLAVIENNWLWIFFNLKILCLWVGEFSLKLWNAWRGYLGYSLCMNRYFKMSSRLLPILLNLIFLRKALNSVSSFWCTTWSNFSYLKLSQRYTIAVASRKLACFITLKEGHSLKWWELIKATEKYQLCTKRYVFGGSKYLLHPFVCLIHPILWYHLYFINNNKLSLRKLTSQFCIIFII